LACFGQPVKGRKDVGGGQSAHLSAHLSAQYLLNFEQIHQASADTEQTLLRKPPTP
jgi:hypothetical protein